MGQLSLEQILRAIKNGPKMTAMAKDINALRRMQEENSNQGGDGNCRTAMRQNIRLVWEYKHKKDGKYLRVPSSWRFPTLPLQNMYLYWHCGNVKENIPPMKCFQNADVCFFGKPSLYQS